MPRLRSPMVASLACAGLAILAAAALAAPTPSSAASVAPVISLNPGTIDVGSVTGTAPPTTAQCETKYKIPCYGPTQIEQAYGTPVLYSKGVEGQGQTIVVVDSFGSPTIASDLAAFDQTYGLPAPPSLKVIQPAGTYTWTGSSDQTGWAGETTLDVEYAHAIAPKARILLVETPVAETEGVTGFPQIVRAENYVIDHHLGGVISQSFNATEQTFPSARSLLDLRSAYVNAYRHHVTVLAASDDSGSTDNESDLTSLYTYPVIGWPASDPLVTAVGGTQLSLDAAGNHTNPDVAWSDSGGGLSSIFNRPQYQNGVTTSVGAKRGIPDISMSGACDGAVITYHSYSGPGSWSLVCGTSESTPLFAGIVALSDQVAHHWLGLVNPALYRLSARHAPGIVDVTSGNNSQTFTQGGTSYTVPGYPAGPGYDLVTGVGTVRAPDFVYGIAR